MQPICAACNERRAVCRGFCARCYQRELRAGRISVLTRKKRDTIMDMVLEAMGDGGPEDCWPWRRSLDKDGYGHMQLSTDNGIVGSRAHRTIYIALTGQDITGLHLDHLCHNWDRSCGGGFGCLHRRCVSPLHLDPISELENHGRSSARFAIQAPDATVIVPRVERCLRGHLYTEENTRWMFDHKKRHWYRRCKLCEPINDANYVARGLKYGRRSV